MIDLHTVICVAEVHPCLSKRELPDGNEAFEGETLTHSPQFAQRVSSWVEGQLRALATDTE
jgi:hypothetical protein